VISHSKLEVTFFCSLAANLKNVSAISGENFFSLLVPFSVANISLQGFGLNL